MAKRTAKKYLSKWKMLADLRRSVLVNYSKIFDNNSKTSIRTKSGEVIMIDQDKIIYNKIRELVVGLSYTYSEKMTKVVA